ncbi:coxsackievirus and adenovirus receptor homolog isoform X2 [Hypomesus transpacificus]|uniref:coxsackievirus and adenovirus receptor homolog isoform X2 n=1 Tax=Hypomesus transpacificus TaxID=137520 RepID=UPI001F083357|nr:coxsackievirus and adenovirus receptor homolog isoform X2 [Hypomesus transpacificus]
MASVVYCLLLTCLISSSNSDKAFLSLDCPIENHGVYGQRSLMKCIAKTNGKENVTIKHVTWKKGDTKLLMVHDGDLTHNIDGFQFADPDWKVNLNASLLLTNTKMSDIGEYECMVYTTIGHQTAKTDLSVTAKYQTPTMNSIQGQNIKDNTDVTLFCNATGGDQKGYIQWFDEFGTNWTQNSELVSSKNENGLFNLSSRLVLKAPSSNYTCLVFNARGVQEGKASLNLQLMSMSGRDNRNSGDVHARYVAPLVIIGSLIAGLLFALLICRRRSQSDGHHTVTTEEDVVP